MTMVIFEKFLVPKKESLITYSNYYDKTLVLQKNIKTEETSKANVPMGHLSSS